MIMSRASLALLLAGVALSALSGAACAAPTDGAVAEPEPAESNDALIGGKAASAGQFPSTVFLKGECTATKVAPKRLLTAAHCVLDPATVSIRYPAGTHLSVAHDPSKGYADVEVAAVHVHPAWMKACEDSYCAASSVTARLDAPDVAVIYLANDLRDVPSTTVDTSTLSAGDRVTLIGFGCTAGVLVADTRETATLKYAETRLVPAERAVHEGSAVLAYVVAQVGGIYSLRSGPGAAKARAGLCPGDSGGPLYRKRDGELVVVGVSSNYTFAPEAKDGVGLPITNWHTRLDAGSKHGVATWLASLGVPTT
jgi:secreted trypsin-like serine protease